MHGCTGSHGVSQHSADAVRHGWTWTAPAAPSARAGLHCRDAPLRPSCKLSSLLSLAFQLACWTKGQSGYKATLRRMPEQTDVYL